MGQAKTGGDRKAKSVPRPPEGAGINAAQNGWAASAAAGTGFTWRFEAGDFNHDGNPDLAGSDGTCVEILLWNGDGTFRALIVYKYHNNSARSSNSLAVGDFNGDRNLDLALAFNPGIDHGRLAVALGNGDGTFQNLRVTYPQINYPWAIRAGDFNCDGKLDLVAAQGSSQPGAEYFLGTGDGTFNSGHALFTPEYAASAAVGDVNGDGAPDIVTLNFFDKSITVLLNSEAVALKRQ